MKEIQGQCRLPRLFLFTVAAIYGIGDLVTTVAGLGTTGITAEANPAMSWILSNFSIAVAITAIILVKIIAVIVICCALAYLYKERLYLTATASAIVLSALGAVAVAGNVCVISGLAVITIDKSLIAALPIILLAAMLLPFCVEELFLKKKYCY